MEGQHGPMRPRAVFSILAAAFDPLLFFCFFFIIDLNRKCWKQKNFAGCAPHMKERKKRRRCFIMSDGRWWWWWWGWRPESRGHRPPPFWNLGTSAVYAYVFIALPSPSRRHGHASFCIFDVQPVYSARLIVVCRIVILSSYTRNWQCRKRGRNSLNAHGKFAISLTKPLTWGCANKS